MIIYAGDKYACVSCIRGHRSSTCKHSDRMLVKVRTRGRPSAQTVRKVILVDADSQVKPKEHSPTPMTGCCPNSEVSMDNQPILFMRAASTKKALLVGGALRIMTEDESLQNDKKYSYVSESEYLRKYAPRASPTTGLPTNGESYNYLERGSDIHAQVPSQLSSQVPEPQFRTKSCCSQKFNLVEAPRSLSNATAELASEHFKEPVNDENSTVQLFTHKGLFLSTQCGCKDDSCFCDNCLLHRKEEEIESYISQSGVPLSTLGNGKVTYPEESVSDITFDCKDNSESCSTDLCLIHPQEVVPMNRLLLYGLFNTILKPKTLINYRQKLIPSKYWWSLLKEEVPAMSAAELSGLDILGSFDDILQTYGKWLPSEYDFKNSFLNGVESMINGPFTRDGI
ncbi:LAMI_0C10682g1_1 [Lachancea mirantina]|uniref:LAMI_0C10682g1_1 n=1 Tax=Lachancea mirantina TaxID=1230905 RepID=A0A1G4J625_9SACH|nr:LAMI_0C10682g1_1 [Lachancea mirantina]